MDNENSDNFSNSNKETVWVIKKRRPCENVGEMRNSYLTWKEVGTWYKMKITTKLTLKKTEYEDADCVRTQRHVI
jgi:hypothetical protein